MKGKLEFELPEESEDFFLASNAQRYHTALFDLDQHLRSQVKYAPDDADDKVIDALEQVRDKLHEIVREYNIEL